MDLFYYGSQDMPLPFRGGPGGPPRSRPGTCESCSAPVSVEELESGQASELFGLVLCPSCKEETHAEERIELYFCDRCQVSVPVFRVDTGEALAGDGQILCLGCREETTRRRFFPLALLGGFLAFLTLGVVVASTLSGEQRGPEADLTPGVVEGILDVLDRELDRLPGEEEASAISDRLKEMVRSADGLREDRNAVLEKLDQSSATLLGTRSTFDERMDRLESVTEGIRRRIESLMEDAPAGR